jgi:hypothetical protein
MAILTSQSGPTSSIRTLYASDYKDGAEYMRLYDQLSHPVSQDGVEKAARLAETLQISFLQAIPPGNSTISETVDVVPINLVDATATISPTSRYVGPVQWHEQLDMRVYTDLVAKRYKYLGEAMGETVDALASDAALQGGIVRRYTVRASLDADTTTHYFNSDALEQAAIMLQQLKCPAYIGNGRPQWMAIGNSTILKDLRNSDTVLAVAEYQDKELIFNYELGQIGPWKLIMNAWGKCFIGQGAACSTTYSTTLASAVSALDKTCTMTSSTNLASGFKWLNIIDTAETSNTHVRTNERVWLSSNSGAVATIVGSGSNGGFKFNHAATTTTVTANDPVYPVAYGTPISLAKMYDSVTGEWGETVLKENQGMLNQWTSLGGKFYGGYGRWSENFLIRGEYSASSDANG